MNYALVFIGGGLGSITRFAFSKHFGTLHNGFPLATFLSNTVSCIILGLAMGILYTKSTANQSSAYLLLLIVTGFCGGFSTFSTFSLETFQLINSGHYFIALTNVLANVTVCFVAVALGLYAGKIL